MSKIKKFLHDFPTTQYRILVSTIGYVAVMVVGVIMGRDIPDGILWFLLGWAFNDVLQFSAKRFTHVSNTSQSAKTEGWEE